MHEQVSLKKPSVCRPGCRCKKGYVLDSVTKKCIKPSECPCHHGGKSYSEGHRISQDCNSWYVICFLLLLMDHFFFTN